MRVAKASLASLLLEEGEEDLAVLIVRSDLPEEIVVERDADALAAIGLSGDELHALLPTIEARGDADPGIAADEMAQLEQTISDRWAHLVSDWTGSSR
ncbi:hypothetical protein [Cryptosporangium aurantiacum]|uniref:Uncharacterized protein n=1 Tax=Cryptosporangium aurantiacum TaxID=134849 RepID=A0A1M7RJP3_9ACTN|nr:hypothetical protein [Cryptosporangium aurantiacum]SHN46527.1 hypothetical protein SAMN05443668_11663 [Cryptosporangium aurantiacum]